MTTKSVCCLSLLAAGVTLASVLVSAETINVKLGLWEATTTTESQGLPPFLANLTPEQRANWRVAGGGFGIHWPDVDEDLATEGLLRGAPAPRGSTPVGRTTA